jgi:hypothetical protein
MSRHNFSRTAIAIANLKEAALYFDHVIPVNLGVEYTAFARSERGEFRDFLDDLCYRGFYDMSVPPALRKLEFVERLSALNGATFDVMRKFLAEKHGLRSHMHETDAEYLSIEAKATTIFAQFLKEFRLEDVPVDCESDLNCGRRR